MYGRIISSPSSRKKSIFLFGPRGTGKTTWLRTSFPDSLYLDLLDSFLYTDLIAQPGRLESLIPPDYDKWIIIDEIQKIPMLLNEVHRLIEKKRYKFILTGSSARSLRRKGVNLLAGRAITHYMHPLTSIELKNDFNISMSLQYGHLPSIFSEPDPRAYLKTYIQTYLREEILQEGLTRNLSSFARFMETASFSQASCLNITEIAREAGIERRTVTNYFDILEDLLLAVRIPVFTKRAKRRMAGHPKFYYFDAGVYRALRPSGPLDTPEEIEGAGLETLCLQELRAVNDYYNLDYNIYYWRTGNGIEVDLVLYGPRGIYAFEIKHSRKISNKDFANLKIFKTDYPDAKCFLLYMGTRKEYRDGIEVWPASDAIRSFKNVI